MSADNKNKEALKLGPVSGWIEERLPVFSYISEHLGQYKTPKNLSYFWNFGSLAGLALIIQIVTGIFLVCIIPRMLIMLLIL